ncbi:MAG: hypothetical protein IKB21_03115, partial [Clostridia bacterium]|nr:hypothetical protein [Clostridia bacterium]
MASKLLVLPSLLYTANQTSAIFSATIIFALEFIFLIFLLKIKKKHPKKTFFNFFENKIGKYQTEEGQTSCKMCSLGQYQDQTKQSSCKNCGRGTYSDEEGLKTCKKCPTGKYQNG